MLACNNRTLVYAPQIDYKNYLVQFYFFPDDELKARFDTFDAYVILT